MTSQAETFTLKNVHLNGNDHLYHIGLEQNGTDALEKRFHDVKYVFMGGKPDRMKEFAEYMYEKLNKPRNSEFEEGDGNQNLKDISKSAGRYSLFKVGPLLSVSHGIGSASLSVVLNEVFKLLFYAKCKADVQFFRIGTSGGLGVEPGTIIVTKQPYDGELRPKFYEVHCGKAVMSPSQTDENLREDLLQAAQNAKLLCNVGNTISTDDFFESQARTDGAFCDYSEEEKSSFLNKAHNEYGIKNIEMESLCFAAMCNRAGVKCAVACVTVVDRLQHDNVTADVNHLQGNLYKLMEEYLRLREEM